MTGPLARHICRTGLSTPITAPETGTPADVFNVPEKVAVSPGLKNTLLTVTDKICAAGFGVATIVGAGVSFAVGAAVATAVGIAGGITIVIVVGFVAKTVVGMVVGIVVDIRVEVAVDMIIVRVIVDIGTGGVLETSDIHSESA